MKPKKIIRKRWHNVLSMARTSMTDDEIAAEIGLTEAEFLSVVGKNADLSRELLIAKIQGRARDMARLRDLVMQTPDPTPQMLKLYYAARHGITDRVEPDAKEDNSEAIADLFREIAEKLPK